MKSQIYVNIENNILYDYNYKHILLQHHTKHIFLTANEKQILTDISLIYIPERFFPPTFFLL